MKIILLLLLFFCFTNVISQKKRATFILEAGCYIYGYEITPATTKFWYIKKDSSFIYLSINKDYQIKAIRIGKWSYLGDSMMSLTYNSLKSTLLLNSKINYLAETKGSTDSVYFKGSIKNVDCRMPWSCGIIFDNNKNEYAKFGVSVGYGFQGIRTDTNGSFNFVIPKNIYFGSIGVTCTPNYYPLTINTFSSNNYHRLDIIVPIKDSANDIDISKFIERPEVYKYRPNKAHKKMQAKPNDLIMNFITRDKTPLLNRLYEARKRQPYLVGPIDELIEFLKD